MLMENNKLKKVCIKITATIGYFLEKCTYQLGKRLIASFCT